jgi:hypothetical protein
LQQERRLLPLLHALRHLLSLEQHQLLLILLLCLCLLLLQLLLLLELLLLLLLQVLKPIAHCWTAGIIRIPGDHSLVHR